MDSEKMLAVIEIIKEKLTDLEHKTLYDEVMKLKFAETNGTLEKLLKLTYDHQEFYYGLVWWGRQDRTDPGRRKALDEFMDSVDSMFGSKADEFRKEIKELDGENSEAHNGFNCGVLAITRLYGKVLLNQS